MVDMISYLGTISTPRSIHETTPMSCTVLPLVNNHNESETISSWYLNGTSLLHLEL